MDLAGLLPVSLDRIVQVQRHLASGAGPTGGVAVLGSSVTVEGIDCEALVAALPTRLPCENLAWTGADARQWLFLAPALREHPPRVIVLGLDLFLLLHPDAIADDRLALAGWGGFVPAAERPSYRAVLSEPEYRVLDATWPSQLLRFRTLPLNRLNEFARETARSDLRYQGYATNFVAPWARLAPASDEALERHLEQIAGVVREGGAPQLPISEHVLAFFVEQVRASGSTSEFVFLITPMHPRLDAMLGPEAIGAIRASVGSLAGRLGATVIDDSLALPAEGFSDAVHPFGAWRKTWSSQVGADLAPLLIP